MPPKAALRSLLSLLALAAMASPARAVVMLRENFDTVPTAEVPNGALPIGTIYPIVKSDAGVLGSVQIASIETAGGPTKALEIRNVAHPENRPPGVLLKWEDPGKGITRVGYKFMTPIDGTFTSIHFFGGDWKTGAAVLVMENGKLTLQYGPGPSRLNLGDYKPNAWTAIRLDFNGAKHTIDVYSNGKKVGGGLAWMPGATAIGQASLLADFKPLDHNGAPVLYIDDIKIENIPAAAPPVADAKPVERKSVGRAFRYGVCAHLNWQKQQADYDRLIEAIDKLGVDVVRDSTDWNRLEPSDNDWDFSKMDQLVNTLNARGVELQAMLAFTARWASTGDPYAKNWLDWSRAAPRPDAFNDYAKTMVTRYKDRVRLWEIWNEEDIAFWQSPTAKYTEMFNAAGATIAKADPDAQILNGGFAMVRRPPNMDFIPDFLRDADASHWNIWAYHDYQTFGQTLARLKENQQYYQSKKLSIPIWVNEGGFHCLMPGGEEEQAITLAKKYAAAPALGLSAYIWYDLIDDGNEPLNTEHHFGLLRRDFTPKPAYIAYQQTIRELAPRRFEKRLPDSSGLPGLWGLVYRSAAASEDDVLVLWREGKGVSTPVWISGATSAVSNIDGTTFTAPSLNGGMLVAASDTPVYVHLRHGAEATVRPVLSLPGQLALLPGEPGKFEIRVSNPTAQQATFTVAAASDSPNVQLNSPSQTFTLAAGESTTIQADASLAGDATHTASGALKIALQADAGGAAVEARLPYQPAQRLPTLADTSAAALPPDVGLKFDLNQSDSVVNLFSAEPVDAMHWHGAADLSATARIAYSADALYLTVDATDDTHHQDQDGENMWKGDSLQLAIRTDDSRTDTLEATFALGADGKPHGWADAVSRGSTLARGKLDGSLTIDARREGTVTHYTVRLPWNALGLKTPPAGGLRMSFLVNDNDGQGRKGWVQLSEGIGRTKNASLFPLFVCQPATAP